MTGRPAPRRRLEIVDSTLREGAQSPLLHAREKYALSTHDKIEIVRALIEYGVRHIELFSPVVHAYQMEELAALLETRDRLAVDRGRAELLAHVRCHPDDIEAAIDAGFDGLHLFLGTSHVSRTHTHGRDLATIARDARHLVETVRSEHPGMILRFSGEDAFRTPLDDLFRIYDEVSPFVDRLGVPDTVGVATRESVICRLAALRQRYPQMAWEAHFHDDRGLALSNALVAIECGVSYVDATVLGVGERSGITSTTALLYNLYLDGRHDLLTDYRLADSYALNAIVSTALRGPVDEKEPVSLTNRMHTAGVHQRAMLRDSTTYEAHPLDRFGVASSEMLLGPLSGSHLVHHVLRDVESFDIDEDTARLVTQAFKRECSVGDTSRRPLDVLLDVAERRFGLTRTSTRCEEGAEPIRPSGTVVR